MRGSGAAPTEGGAGHSTPREIYAVTYNGPVAAATGKVYVHDLNADGTMAAGDWREAMTGLTSEAFFTIAVDQPSNPSNVYAGGEGISLFKASGGLNDGALQWYESKTGLENLIMARMPILFTGQTSLSYIPVYLGGSRFYFEVYMEDINGNPPIVGSTFTAITYDAKGGVIETIYTKTYCDNYVEEGTYRDPSNPTTNIPIVTPVVDFSGEVAKVEFTFTPACNTAVPGCSGAAQVAAFGF